MKKIIALPILLIVLVIAAKTSTAQSKKKRSDKPLTGLGIKVGLNYANVTNAKAINGSNRTGFTAGAFLAPPSKSIISSRTELLFSRQGYDWKSASNTGSVNLDYLVLPQLMGINITQYVQLQVGAQMAYLLNAKADSSGTSTGNPQVDKIMDLYNRFDYGAAGGIEIYPIKNLLIGARLNISFGKLYKEPAETQSAQPNFFPGVDAKNNVVQLFLGFHF